MSLTIARATAEDARALAEMRYEFRTALKPASESAGDFVERCVRWMVDRLRGDGDWEGEAIGYITNFFVREQGRNAGIGTRLLQMALSASEEWGCEYVILWPTPRSRGLYERNGFSVREDVLVRFLPRGGSGAQ